MLEFIMINEIKNVYYTKYYSLMVGKNSSGFIGYLAKFPHYFLEKPFRTNKGLRILEVGGGQGEHLSFVIDDYESYLLTDINSEQLQNIDLSKFPNVSTEKMNAEHLKSPSDTFDRVISTCLLSHLSNPSGALLEWRRVVRDGGKISIYLSTDPSLALRIFRKLSTARKAKHLGFNDYLFFIANEHLNSAHSLIEIIKRVFGSDLVNFSYRPFFFKSWYLNLVCVVQITVNKR